MKNARAVSIALACMIGGCATSVETISVNNAGMSAYQNRTLVAVTQAAPGMTPMRASSAAFGAIGGLAMASAARNYASEHGVVDPATHIETQLTALLQSRYGIQTVGDRLDMSAVTERTDYPINSDLLYVDAKTYMWMQRYFSSNWGRFRIDYSTLIQIIDGATGRAVAQYDCRKFMPETPDDAPTLEELEANNGALMNQMLMRMADECLAEFAATSLPAS
ncbi:hypothetical protein [Candidatus Viadribacter manganicus]|nr:hypothetical protein [Candidatus Viadribacter manganicus]